VSFLSLIALHRDSYHITDSPAVTMASPPPAPSATGSEHQHDLSSNSFDFNVEETPLISHTKRPAQNGFRTQPQYAAITEDTAPARIDNKLSRIDSLSKDEDETGCSNDGDDQSVSSTASMSSLSSITTLALENFREGLLIPFTDEEGSAAKIIAGLASLSVVGTFCGLILPKNENLHGKWGPWYQYVSSVIGYNYFVLWSVCFYPQVRCFSICTWHWLHPFCGC
jgi:hypothetical protein